jgi:hypothetical protein
MQIVDDEHHGMSARRLDSAKTDSWWLRRDPLMRSLAFRPGAQPQDRVTWQIRLIEGDLTGPAVP